MNRFRVPVGTDLNVDVNPYAPGTESTPSYARVRKRPSWLYVVGGVVLLMLSGLTFGSAIYDSRKVFGSRSGVYAIAVLSIIPQIPFLLIYFVAKTRSVPLTVFGRLLSCLVIGFGCLCYFGFAMSDPIPSTENSGNLHGLVFPIFYGAISVLGLLVFGVLFVFFPDRQKASGPIKGDGGSFESE